MSRKRSNRTPAGPPNDSPELEHPPGEDTAAVVATPLAPRRCRIREDGAVELDTTVASGSAVAPDAAPADAPPRLLYQDPGRGLLVYQANCLELLDALADRYPEGHFDMIFADPPYFLSNGGITCHGGKMVKVDKGAWDKSRGHALNHEFNLEWLRRCQRVLKPNGTIWVTGTLHVIFSVGFAMQQLGFKLLNDIAWEKPNPPPNLSCRYFTHSTETVLWAAKSESSRHKFNYKLMRQVNGGRQMKTVWKIGAPGKKEKALGKHPAQKPLALVERCILAATDAGDWILDPFLGVGTTAAAALRAGRRCVGIENDAGFAQLAVDRLLPPFEQPGNLGCRRAK